MKNIFKTYKTMITDERPAERQTCYSCTGIQSGVIRKWAHTLTPWQVSSFWVVNWWHFLDLEKTKFEHVSLQALWLPHCTKMEQIAPDLEQQLQQYQSLTELHLRLSPEDNIAVIFNYICSNNRETARQVRHFCDCIFFPAHKLPTENIFCQSGYSFKGNRLPTSSKQMRSSESEMRALLLWLCKCSSIWKFALNNSALNQLLILSLLKIHITHTVVKNCPITVYVAGDGAARNKRGGMWNGRGQQRNH